MFAAGTLRSLARRASFSSLAAKWEGGVSMVQGASRGIGLEFVSSSVFFFSLAISIPVQLLVSLAIRG